MTATGSRIAALLAAAEPPDPKPLGGLIDRLEAAGQLGRDVAPPASPEVRSTSVRGVVHDSRAVRPGSLFVAVPGAHVDGHRFVPAAARSGAAVAIVETVLPDVAIPQIVVRSSQRALAAAAAWWYEDPSLRIGVVGITGTDGKTTTSYLATAALEAAGVPSGMLGTIATEIGDVREPNDEHATTPEAPRLQAALRAMIQAGDRAAVVETTSHGLALERVGGIAYDVGILTNLSHEHLEFHGTFEAYRAAKRSLFERLANSPAKPGIDWPTVGIVNADDGSFEVFAEATREAGARLVTYGAAAAADVRLLSVGDDEGRLGVRYQVAGRERRVRLRLAGAFNAHNALAVVALGDALGLDPDAIDRGLESVEAVPGRMERLDAGQPFEVVVDYAHSPASLETVLGLLAPVAAARGGGLIAVFGSAGERDRAKRPMMGRIAAQRCRLVIAADEDPRGEDRQAILEEIAAGAEEAGARRGDTLLLIADRREAIRAAFRAARSGDVVLLAGKGHEPTILMADGAIPWDERSEVLAALREMGWGSG